MSEPQDTADEVTENLEGKMKFNIQNTKGWYKLDKKYEKLLKPFSLKFDEIQNGRKHATIEVDSLQEIVDIIKKTGEEIIISNYPGEENMTIEIYDGWRE